MKLSVSRDHLRQIPQMLLENHEGSSWEASNYPSLAEKKLAWVEENIHLYDQALGVNYAGCHRRS